MIIKARLPSSMFNKQYGALYSTRDDYASVSEEEKTRIGNSRKASSGIPNNTLDEGVITFGLW
jgi:hypothetical protein